MDLELILRQAEEHIVISKLLGNLGGNLGHLDIAVFLYDKVLELDPKDSIAYTSRGHAFNCLGKFAEAVTDLTTAIELDPTNSAAYTNRGHAFDSLGKFAEAVTDLTTAIELDPDHSGAYSNRGNSHRLMGDAKSAEIDYQQAFTIFRQNPRPEVHDYRYAIRAERGLVKLGLLEPGIIELTALQEGVITPDQLVSFYRHE